MLAADPEVTVTIPLTATAQGETASGDYTLSATSVTFTAGETSKMVTVTATADEEEETGESVVLGFGELPEGFPAGDPATAEVALVDASPEPDDPNDPVDPPLAPALTATAGGSTRIDLSWDAADGEGRAEVTGYGLERSPDGVSGWTGVAPPPSGVATTYEDTGLTPATTYHYRVFAGSEAGDSPASNVASATTDGESDPDITVEFGASEYRATEGGPPVEVAVVLSADPEGAVTVDLTAAPQDDIAAFGVDRLVGAGDYELSATSVTFAAGETRKTITVTALADDEAENDETVLLGFGTLSGGLSPGARATATVTLADARPGEGEGWIRVRFGRGPYTATEAGAAAEVEIEMGAPDRERPVTVPLTASPQGGAAAGDYTLSASSVTFTAGETRKTVTVTATPDEEEETGESVLLGMGDLPAGFYAGDPATATVTLADPAPVNDGGGDDGSGVLAIADVTVAEGDVGTTDATSR